MKNYAFSFISTIQVNDEKSNDILTFGRQSFKAFQSPDKVCIRAKFFISFCTEDGMLKASETAVCNFSNFHCCSMRCLPT